MLSDIQDVHDPSSVPTRPSTTDVALRSGRRRPLQPNTRALEDAAPRQSADRGEPSTREDSSPPRSKPRRERSRELDAADAETAESQPRKKHRSESSRSKEANAPIGDIGHAGEGHKDNAPEIAAKHEKVPAAPGLSWSLPAMRPVLPKSSPCKTAKVVDPFAEDTTKVPWVEKQPAKEDDQTDSDDGPRRRQAHFCAMTDEERDELHKNAQPTPRFERAPAARTKDSAAEKRRLQELPKESAGAEAEAQASGNEGSSGGEGSQSQDGECDEAEGGGSAPVAAGSNQSDAP